MIDHFGPVAQGIADMRTFPWLEAPEEPATARAEQLLRDLGAADPTTGQMTALGQRMVSFPMHPRYARMLLAAEEYDCVYHACLIAALTQGRDLLVRNPGKDVAGLRNELFGEKESSDFWILIRAWNYALTNQFRIDALRKVGIHGLTARQVGPLHEQFLRIARDEGLNVPASGVTKITNEEALRKCILIGFSDRVARRAPHHRADRGNDDLFRT